MERDTSRNEVADRQALAELPDDAYAHGDKVYVVSQGITYQKVVTPLHSLREHIFHAAGGSGDGYWHTRAYDLSEAPSVVVARTSLWMFVERRTG